MRYKDMPKGRNDDICVRCGEHYGYMEEARYPLFNGGEKPPGYDLLCLARTNFAGYTTHGNVKLCGRCMAGLLDWLEGRADILYPDDVK